LVEAAAVEAEWSGVLRKVRARNARSAAVHLTAADVAVIDREVSRRRLGTSDSGGCGRVIRSDTDPVREVGYVNKIRQRLLRKTTKHIIDKLRKYSLHEKSLLQLT
jgi:hypothetical protein